MPERRHFLPPWSIEDIGGYFVVKTNNGQPLVFISYGEGVARQSIARLLARDAARRIAAGIAKLPVRNRDNARLSIPWPTGRRLSPIRFRVWRSEERRHPVLAQN